MRLQSGALSKILGVHDADHTALHPSAPRQGAVDPANRMAVPGQLRLGRPFHRARGRPGSLPRHSLKLLKDPTRRGGATSMRHSSGRRMNYIRADSSRTPPGKRLASATTKLNSWNFYLSSETTPCWSCSTTAWACHCARACRDCPTETRVVTAARRQTARTPHRSLCTAFRQSQTTPECREQWRQAACPRGPCPSQRRARTCSLGCGRRPPARPPLT